MKRRLIMVVILCVWGGLFVSNGYAEVAIGLTAGDITSVTNQYGSCYGWKFTLNKDIVITYLGLYDDVDRTCSNCTEGFDWDYELAILQSPDNTPLAQTTITAGETLENLGGVYRWKAIDDLPLSQYVTPGDPNSGLAVYWVVFVAHDKSGVFDQHIQAVSTYEPAAAINVGAGDSKVSGYVFPFTLTPVLQIPNTPSGDPLFSVNFMFNEVPSVLTVNIDIKPGSETNAINLGSNGLIPVAILSTVDFDATTVDVDSIELAGSGVAVRGKGNKYLASESDVNGDGLLDLVVHVETENLDPNTFQEGQASLTGTTTDGVDIEGWDNIQIVPLD